MFDSLKGLYDLLPSPQNLKLWVIGGPSYPLCSVTAMQKSIFCQAVKLACHKGAIHKDITQMAVFTGEYFL